MEKSASPKIESEKATFKISLSSGTKVTCQEGEKFKEGEVLGQLIQKGEVKEYNLAKILKVSPKKVKKFLLCSLGNKVNQDQIIGEKKGFFGSQLFRSPVSGIIDALTETGILKIRLAGEKIDIPMPVTGEVKEKTEKEIVIEFPALVLKGEISFGGEEWGSLQLIGDQKKKIDLADLNREVKDGILVMAGSVPQALIHKTEALGGLGIVAGEVDEEEVDDLVVLVAGGKEGKIPEKIWEELSSHQGEKVFLSGKKKELVIPVNS
jgi:hypothetical protein